MLWYKRSVAIFFFQYYEVYTFQNPFWKRHWDTILFMLTYEGRQTFPQLRNRFFPRQKTRLTVFRISINLFDSMTIKTMQILICYPSSFSMSNATSLVVVTRIGKYTCYSKSATLLGHWFCLLSRLLRQWIIFVLQWIIFWIFAFIAPWGLIVEIQLRIHDRFQAILQLNVTLIQQVWFKESGFMFNI